MKNADLWQTYRDFTGEVTNNSRVLAFAAGAGCWLFRDENFQFPLLILISLAFTVGFFLTDTLQFMSHSMRLRSFTRKQEIEKYEQTGKIEGDYDVPWELDRNTYRFWIAKVVFMLLAWMFIAAQILLVNTGGIVCSGHVK